MLKNELKGVEEILIEKIYSDSNSIAQTDLRIRFGQIYQAWEEVLFSNMPESSLVRYFHYHIEIILNISSRLSLSPNPERYFNHQNELLTLIDHLRKYCSNYFNEDAVAPVMYHQRLVSKLSENISAIQERLESGGIDPALTACLSRWFHLVSEHIGTKGFSFRSLHYFEYIIDQLSEVDGLSTDAETSLVSLLVRSNFNNLSFFVYLQDTIRNSAEYLDKAARLDYLIKQKALMMSYPEVKNCVYDPAWPSIKTMITDWLQEEIMLAEKSLANKDQVAVSKIPLEMSVAHLSCLVRLLYEESVFATQNLQFIFKSIAGHYQSKRQAVISPGSLSKEFYSINQHTAARVRDLLQRMVQRINGSFFPVVFAVNAIILSYLNSC